MALLSLMLTAILPEVLHITSTSHLVAMSVAGMLLSSQFPVNYFSISEVEQFFPAFADEYGQFERSLGGAGKFWRFNRLHDYANKACFCLLQPVTLLPLAKCFTLRLPKTERSQS